MAKRKDAMQYEPTKIKKHSKIATPTRIKVTDGKEKIEMQQAKNYKETKAIHKAEIKKLKNDIKKHKLLIKQAKIVFQLSK